MRVACVLANGFEDSEFKQPYDALKQAGHEVTIVGMEAERRLNGDKGKETATTEKAFADLSPDEFDALLIPGGFSPDRLRAQPPAVAFVKSFFEKEKPILAICHGPQLFITAGTYGGHRLTAWKTIQGDLKLLGADVVDEEVVVDRNLVTSRQPQDLPAFIREGLKLLSKVPTAVSTPRGTG
jgi:protease I